MAEANYSSGDDYVVEFLGYHFSFNAMDFEQRVVAAAVKLGLLEVNELEEEETADLVELAARGRIREPGSPLGRVSAISFSSTWFGQTASTTNENTKDPSPATATSTYAFRSQRNAGTAASSCHSSASSFGKRRNGAA